MPPIRLPFLADIPVIGPALYNQQALVYFSWALMWAVVWFSTAAAPGWCCAQSARPRDRRIRSAIR